MRREDWISRVFYVWIRCIRIYSMWCWSFFFASIEFMLSINFCFSFNIKCFGSSGDCNAHIIVQTPSISIWRNFLKKFIFSGKKCGTTQLVQHFNKSLRKAAANIVISFTNFIEFSFEIWCLYFFTVHGTWIYMVLLFTCCAHHLEPSTSNYIYYMCVFVPR